MRLVAFYSLEKKYSDNTVNFGGKYFYDVRTRGKRIIFKRVKNESFIENFYGQYISLFNAVVGKNGSGKTTFLKTILQSENLILIFEKHNSKDDNEWLISNSKNYSNKTIGIISINNKHDETLEILQQDLDQPNYFGNHIFDQLLESPTFFYHSPFSNYNLSTKYLDDFSIKNDSIVLIRKEVLQRQIKLLLDKKTIEALKNIYADFPTYSSVIFTIDDSINSSLEELDFRFYTFYKNNEFQFKDDLSAASKDKKFIEEYSKDLKSKLYIDIFNNILKYTKESKNRERFYLEIYLRFLVLSYGLIGFKHLNIINEKINKLVVAFVDDKLRSDAKFELLIEQTITHLLSISEKNYEFAIVSKFEHTKYQIQNMLKNLPNNLIYEELEFKLSEFYSNYFNFIYEIEFQTGDFALNFTVPFILFNTNYPLSHGEDYLLNLFADIYSNNDVGSCKNIVLFLDEPDSGFHPKWKKKIVQSLIKALPILIKNISPKKLNIESFENDIPSFSSLQVVFTTHNPLTLSDVPNHNVIYLYKSANETHILEITDSNRPTDTFATNINELMTHSFYIDDGLMGDFAKEKIEEVIIKLNVLELLKEIDFLYNTDINISKEKEFRSRLMKNAEIYLNSNKLYKDFDALYLNIRSEKDTLLKTILIIGEPVIKKKLLEMYQIIFESEDSRAIARAQIEAIAKNAGLNINIQ